MSKYSVSPYELRGPLILDLECTMPGPPKKRAHPAWGSTIVMEGVARKHTPIVFDARRTALEPLHRKYNLLVGQNIKFDLGHYIWADLLEEDVLAASGVWDTQLAEYLLSGQTAPLMSLDKLSEKYGGTQKIDEVKELWAQGVDTADIDPDLLASYLKDDVNNTRLVYQAQREQLKYKSEEFQKMFWEQMDVLKALTVVENNGMCLDLDVIAEQRDAAMEELAYLEEKFEKAVTIRCGTKEKAAPFLEAFNPNSTSHIAALIEPDVWGHKFKAKVKEQVGFFKNGKSKFKNKEVLLREGAPVSSGVIEATAAGNPVLDESVLKDIADSHDDAIARAIAKHALRYRALHKDVNTYMTNLIENTAVVGSNALLFGNFNQAVTRTGRLSSSSPNLQNMNGKSDIKKAFVSRFGDDGEIVELDYSQLEVIGLAMLTGDKQLKQDILDGVDMHYQTGKTVFGWKTESDMDKATRRDVKGVNFGIIYGGGAKGLAAQTGLPVPTVKLLIEAFYKRYPGVKQWQDDMVQQVSGSMTGEHVEGKLTPKGNPVFIGGYTSPTGREYKFHTYDAPEWSDNEVSFSPTEIKNYMVQGTATGDIVPMALARVWKAFIPYHKEDKAYLTCTVHDSIIIDTRKEYSKEVTQLAKEIMESMPEVLKNVYGWDFDLPLKVGVSSGPNWKDQTEHEEK